MKKTQTFITARSKEDGIVFYSNIVPFWAMETFLDNLGNTHSRLIPAYLDKCFACISTLNNKDTKVKKWKVLVFDLVLIMLSIIIFAIYKNLGVICASIFFSILVSYEFFNFIKFSYNFKCKKGKRYSTGKFHSAEHMVLNAYEKLGRIPTLEELKGFSRFSNRCGINEKIFRICVLFISSILIAFMTGSNTILCLLLFGLFVSFMLVALKYGWLNFLQVLVTNKPSDKELTLAIEALRQFEIMEENLKKQKHSFVTSKLSDDFLF